MSSEPRKFAENIEIRRNVYDKSGKELAATKDKETNGEEAADGEKEKDPADKAVDELSKEPKKPIYCHSCGIDTTCLYFHRFKTSDTANGSAASQQKYDLCPNCYREGKYLNSAWSTDFVKLEQPNYSQAPDSDAPWSDAELLRLLEALETNDDNWTRIADEVGTRSREECVMKFLQLEIEDKYLEEPEDKPSINSALNYGRIPYSNSENPVMSVVAYLASMAEPAVTAAAAGKSVEAMRAGLRRQLENGSGPDLKGKNKESTTEPKTEDSMDLDARPSSTALDLSISESGEKLSHASLGLSSAAGRAGALASHEERAISRLVSSALNTQLEKFELKLKHFAEMEAVLQAERQELERGRRQLFLDRLAFKKRVGEVQAQFGKMSVGTQNLAKEEKLGFASATGSGEGLEPPASVKVFDM